MKLTPIYRFPYPEGSDLVTNGDEAIQALALAVEAALSPAWVVLAPLGANYSGRAGYLTPSYQLMGSGQVSLRGGLTKATAIVSGETVFTLPPEAQPTAAVSVVISVHRSGTVNSVAGKLDIATTGVATVHVIDAQAPVSFAMDGARFSKGP
jgi:hypothetical protein